MRKHFPHRPLCLKFNRCLSACQLPTRTKLFIVFLGCDTILLITMMLHYFSRQQKKANINLTPVTLSSNIKQNLNNNRLCIHINGYIGNLNETTLHHEFKLTANSYLSQTSILNSPWGDYVVNDLETAKCIVLLGLSLKYDLDLSRVIFSEEFRKKAMIISAQS